MSNARRGRGVGRAWLLCRQVGSWVYGYSFSGLPESDPAASRVHSTVREAGAGSLGQADCKPLNSIRSGHVHEMHAYGWCARMSRWERRCGVGVHTLASAAGRSASSPGAVGVFSSNSMMESLLGAKSVTRRSGGSGSTAEKATRSAWPSGDACACMSRLARVMWWGECPSGLVHTVTWARASPL